MSILWTRDFLQFGRDIFNFGIAQKKKKIKIIKIIVCIDIFPLRRLLLFYTTIPRGFYGINSAQSSSSSRVRVADFNLAMSHSYTLRVIISITPVNKYLSPRCVCVYIIIIVIRYAGTLLYFIFFFF